MMFPGNNLGFRMNWVFLPLLAGVLAANLADSAFGEERKFTLMLAVPTKSIEGDIGDLVLPNPNDIWDHYFDHTKNSGEERVDSFAEYWREISYGNVSVSGDVFGWVEIPWPIIPATHETLDGQLSFIDLTANGFLDPFEGEEVPHGQTQKILIDYNGLVEGTATPGYMQWWLDIPTDGLQDFHPITDIPVWTPGERFLDLNNNGRYDALLEGTWDGYANEGCTPDDIIDDDEVADGLEAGGDDDGVWDFPEPFEDFLVIYNPWGG